MSNRGANVTVTIGAAFAGSFKSVLREADRELKNFGKRATKSMRSFGAASAKAAKGVGAITAAGKDMTVVATQGRKAARVTKSISAATVKMSKAQVRAAKATGVANGNAATIMGLPSKAMLRDAQRTMKKYRSAVKPVAANDLREMRVEMPKAYKAAVRETVREIRKGSRQMARAANANAMPGMPAGFGRASRGLPGVTMGGRPPRAANGGAAPSPAQRRTASGVPSVPQSRVAQPWGGPPSAPPPGGGRGGRGGGRGGRRHGRAIPGNPTGYNNAPHQHRTNVHSHDGQAIVGGIGAAVTSHTIWDAVKSAGELTDLQVLLKLQGRNTQEIQEATDAARRIAAKYPNISTTDAMKSIIDVADTGDRDMKKAARLAPLMARAAKAVSIISEGDGEAKGRLGEGQSRFMGRAIEDLGYGTKSEPEIKALVDEVVGGTIATRGIFNPRELFQVIQKSGGMARGWSKEYMGQVLPAIVMAMGGSGAGDASYMFQKLLTKGQGQLSSAKAMMDLGLINKKDLLYDGNKFLQVRPDAMPQADLLRQNPYEWFKAVMMPAAMRKSGITDVAAERKRFNTEHAGDADLSGLTPDETAAKLNDKFVTHLADTLQKHVDTFAKAKNTAKMFADLIAQQEQIDAMVAQIRKQPKNAIDIMMNESFTANVDKLKNSLHTLMTALGGPEVGPAVAAMDSISRALANVAVAAAADPGATAKVMAAFAAITAGFAAVSLAGITATVLTAAGPFGLALGAIAAGMAAWAMLDWDGFSESMSKLMTIGQALKSVFDFFNTLGDDANGESLIGRAVSKMLGNDKASNNEKSYLEVAGRRDAIKKQLDSYVPGARGTFPGQLQALQDDLARTEAELKAKGEANIKYAQKEAKKKESEARATKAISDFEARKKELADKQEQARNLEKHIEHADHTATELNKQFQPKAQIPLLPKAKKGDRNKSIRKGDQTGTRPPLSAENVVQVAPTNPGAAAAAAAHGPAPGSAVAAAGGNQGPIKVEQPLRLVTPVLITAQGIISVKDDAVQAAVTGLTGQFSAINGTLQGILAACNGIIGAINAKQFTVNMPAGAGGSAGSAGASRERQSFSD